jgi:hypothetical protein
METQRYVQRVIERYFLGTVKDEVPTAAPAATKSK